MVIFRADEDLSRANGWRGHRTLGFQASPYSEITLSAFVRCRLTSSDGIEK